MWVSEAMDHNIIQLFNSNNIAQCSWRQFNKLNDFFEEYFATTKKVKLCKTILLLYTLGI